MRSVGRRTAVFFSNGAGDHVLCLPALRALTKVLDGNLVLAYSRGPHAFFLDDLAFDSAVQIPFDSTATFDPLAAATLIGEVDGFISLTPWMSPSLTSLMTELKPAWSLGFFPEFHRQLALDFAIHAADLAFRIPQTFDAELRFEDFAGPAPLPEAAVSKARDVRRLAKPNTRVLVVHNETKEHKILDPGRLSAVVHTFLERHPDVVALSVGHRPVISGHNRVITFDGPLSLAQSCALVAAADCFLGVDSCFLHVADFARVPSVGLFGPTSAHEFGFRLGPHVAVQAQASMAEIEVADVLAALDIMLANPGHAGVVAPGVGAHAAAFASPTKN